MRRLLVTIAAAGTALAFATPAAAQYFPQQRAYSQGYNQYGNRYGGNNVAQWQQDLNQIRYSADNLRRQGRLTRNEARDLNNDIWSVQRSLNTVGYRGLAPWEARQIQEKFMRLRYEMRRYSDYDGRYNNRYDRYGSRY
jgi:hypothetical protein